MATRMNFTRRKKQRKEEAEARNTAYKKLSLDEKIQRNTGKARAKLVKQKDKNHENA